MPDTARARTGLQASLGTDDIRSIDDTMIAAFNIIETLMPLDSQGTSAPAGTGKRGEWYYRTSTGELFRSTGSAWVNVGAMISDGEITSAKIADGTIVVGDLANSAVETAKIKDANVTRAKLAPTIKAERFTGSSIANVGSGAVYSSQTFTWAAPFADANYTVTATCLGNDNSGAGLRVVRIRSKTASQVVVELANEAGFQTYTPEVHLIAFHD